MSDPRNVQHDKKVIQEKLKHGEDLTKDAAHVPQPGKKTAHAKPHGAHVETQAEKSGGSVAETDHALDPAHAPDPARLTNEG